MTGITVVPPIEIVLMTRLQSLTLDDNALKEKGMARLATFVCMCKYLQTLSLRNCMIEDSCFSLLCDRLFGFKLLSKIDVSDNRITDISIENGLCELLISAMPPPLTEIVLATNMISNTGAQLLFESLALSEIISSVNLSDNRLDNEFVIWLQRLLKNHRLNLLNKSVSLTSVILTENGLKYYEL